MFTAEEARKLGKINDVQTWVEKATLEVKEFVTKNPGKTELIIRNKFWEQHGYSSTEEWKAAVKMFAKLGYKATFYYDDSTQFCNLGLHLDWSL